MSRVGKQPIVLTHEVKAEIKAHLVSIQGPKGSLHYQLPQNIVCQVEEGKLVLRRTNELRTTRALHGLARRLLFNMVMGVTKGYQRDLEVIGVGYRVQLQGDRLTLLLGHSEPNVYQLPKGISVETEISAGVEKNTIIHIQGIDKYLVGEVAAELRRLRPPEPYKGKGVKYVQERIRRKTGKTGVTGAPTKI
ncbi:MAG: 50S ribosomal protein L6 [bacterium]|nr:50S ribosomal protein L6 [bacterium]